MIRKLVQYIVFVIAFFIGAALVFVVAAVFFNADVFGFFVTSATKVVGVFGEHLPVLETRYGKLQIKSKKSAEGQRIEIGCAECRLAHRYIGQDPFRTANAVIEGTFNKKRFVGELQIENVRVKIDALWDHNNVSGSFEIPKSEIADIYHAIRSIVPEEEGAKITGTVAGKGKFSWPQFYFFFEPDIENFTVDGLVDEAKYRSGKFSYNAEGGEGHLLTVESGEGTDNWFPLSEAGRWLPAAVISVEDRGFYQHPGYDLRSMLEATTFNKRKGEIRRGGSTITQQLAKNLFLDDERTYSRKLRELLYSVEMDRELGKKRVIELYLNVVEWGPDIFGAKVASGTYFNKAPADLLPEEAAWLGSILRSPKRAYRQQFERNQPQSVGAALALEHMSGLSETERAEALSRAIRFAR